MTNPIIHYFAYDHLPEKLQVISKPFADMVQAMEVLLPDCTEKSVAFRKLLEAKDAAVRASL